MKYKLVKTVTGIDPINSLLLELITNQDIYFCDSVLETEDRIIVRYLKNVVPGGKRYPDEVMRPYLMGDTILYIHFSKRTWLYIKICVYEKENSK